ncbi:metal transport protein [Mycobacterium lentiflavum]|uniref:Cation diffusion facilitator family transporter n=2 Tax=Mycobacterium simiae complex TaxID=2249310 RepID=A0A0E4CRP0_MYCLN|nr:MULTISPECIES: cation diffusion facilitator family transporter [Mycobacterium simiae complex]MEE3062418.1 cation diffusion facilitator family transporter [Actinomycetota bacterium]ORJ52736.1 cation transporter [Mycobacterium simiae]ULP45498.1 cation diffusion facilitator family transporter [Mycobacterium lentiflavum]CQD24819.1 metal transport protein [Mycobacterium lentiflavum]
MSAGHNHTHGHSSPDSDRRWLVGALAVIVAFMLAEVSVGIVAKSLALLSDAAHMLTDAASIALALWAIRLAARPAAGRMTYGWRRVEILSAQANGVTLLVLAGWLGFEAVNRLIHPPRVAGTLVLVTALVGVVVNVAATWMISRANRTSLNVEGAFQHILNDLFAFIATAVAGLVIVLTGFLRADAIATLIVVALMARAGVGLVKAASLIFLEAAPSGTEPAVIGEAMAAHEAVVEVHDLHVWEITSGQPALSAHIIVAETRDCHSTRIELAQLLGHEHGISHTTLQMDHDGSQSTSGDGHSAGAHCEEPHGPIHRSTKA